MLQFQSDILNVPVVQPVRTEMPSLGAAYLAGLAVGFWNNKEELKAQHQVAKTFKAQMDKEKVDYFIKYWNKAVEKSRSWIDPMD